MLIGTPSGISRTGNALFRLKHDRSHRQEMSNETVSVSLSATARCIIRFRKQVGQCIKVRLNRLMKLLLRRVGEDVLRCKPGIWLVPLGRTKPAFAPCLYSFGLDDCRPKGGALPLHIDGGRQYRDAIAQHCTSCDGITSLVKGNLRRSFSIVRSDQQRPDCLR